MIQAIVFLPLIGAVLAGLIAIFGAHARHPGDLLAAAIEENVKINVKRMYDDVPILSEALAAKKIAVVGGVYDLATGRVGLL